MSSSGTNRPTKLGGGKAPQAAAAQAAQQEHQPIRPELDPNQELPKDVAAAMAAQGGLPATTTPAAPPAAPAASGLAEKLAFQQPSEGNPNPSAVQAGPAISLGALLQTAPMQPEDDKYNPGWRLPRYFYAAVRLIAFRLGVDQSKVAEELMYAAMMGQKPGGVLSTVPPQLITQILQQAHTEAARALGVRFDG